MNFFLFSGIPRCGKSTSIWNLYQCFISNGYSLVSPYTAPQHLPVFPLPTTPIPDISCVISNKVKKVILHSASDDKQRMDELFVLYQANPDVDAVITTIRNPISSTVTYLFDPRAYFLSLFQPYSPRNFCVEFPLAKTNAATSFHGTIILHHHSLATTTSQHILSQPPFYLL